MTKVKVVFASVVMLLFISFHLFPCHWGAAGLLERKDCISISDIWELSLSDGLDSTLHLFLSLYSLLPCSSLSFSFHPFLSYSNTPSPTPFQSCTHQINCTCISSYFLTFFLHDWATLECCAWPSQPFHISLLSPSIVHIPQALLKLLVSTAWILDLSFHTQASFAYIHLFHYTVPLIFHFYAYYPFFIIQPRGPTIFPPCTGLSLASPSMVTQEQTKDKRRDMIAHSYRIPEYVLTEKA